LIDSQTGEYREGDNQTFNATVTCAIFPNVTSFKHEKHFGHAKQVIEAMIAGGVVEPIFGQNWEIIGIRLCPPELSDENGAARPDRAREMLGVTLGALAATTAERNDVWEEFQQYVSDTEGQLEPLIQENANLRAENERLRQENAELQHSPREAELLEEIERLREELASKDAAKGVLERQLARSAAETHAEQAKNRGVINRNQELSDEITHLKGAIEEVKKIFGYDRLAHNISPEELSVSIRLAVDYIKERNREAMFNNICSFLNTAGFTKAVIIISQYFIDDEMGEKLRTCMDEIHRLEKELASTSKKAERKIRSKTNQIEQLEKRVRSLVEEVFAQEEIRN
jgi:regulator of replication initiation timing